jgi:hypothetical protein
VTAPGIRHLWLAALRVALVPVVLLGERLVDQPVAHTGAFPFLLAAYGVWAAVLLALNIVHREPPALDRIEPFIDLAAIVALTYASGGPFSETATAFFVLPVLAAARLRPRVTASWALGATACFVLLSVVHPNASEAEATARIVSQAAYLALIGLAATLVSYVLQHRDRAIASLAEQRGQLVTHALTAEQRERRRLAELLHDESVQTLSVARQELGDYRRTGREASFERARSAIDETLAQLRGEIFELHPYVLDDAGLVAALNALRSVAARRVVAGRSHRTGVERAACGVRRREPGRVEHPGRRDDSPRHPAAGCMILGRARRARRISAASSVPLRVPIATRTRVASVESHSACRVTAVANAAATSGHETGRRHSAAQTRPVQAAWPTGESSPRISRTSSVGPICPRDWIRATSP